MIGRIRGELVIKQPPRLMIDVGGIGYEAEAPMSTFYDLPQVGQTVVLFTHLHVREDAHTLYAFASEEERGLFRDLIRVSGVGARIALAVLSGMSARKFRLCIHEGDSRGLTKVPGIGRKTAERLVVEMRDRLTDIPLPAAGSAPSHAVDPVGEAIHALVALGYNAAEASRMVGRIDTGDLASEDIIRKALQSSLT
ncbi:MAG: Holliday junction branch migration protein RuvA [Gammaproteobacteria bacterium]|nr:Holliday junction branch migration protein RuvA [Gammaproteobacteria bacterium]